MAYLWIAFTIMAAAMQSWRNALQGQLAKEVSTLGATLARFLWAAPIAALYLTLLYYWRDAELPEWQGEFVGYIFAAAIMQILATALMVRLFKQRNFAIGVGLAKSEALMAAILGTIFFGTQLSLLGWGGVVIGAIAVILMSSRGKLTDISLDTLLLGIACGSAFALTSLWIRQASISSGLLFPHSAAWVLLLVISLQTLILVGFLIFKEPSSLLSLWRRPKLVFMTSLFSALGSIGWFSAMSLQTVPYVKTLGQVEILFTLLVGRFYLKQKVKFNDLAGLLLIGIAAVMVMWSG